MHGLGAALPDRVIPTAAAAKHLGVKEEWILQRLGVHQRHVLSEGERLTDLAALAASRAIEDAGIEPTEIDLVIAASRTRTN